MRYRTLKRGHQDRKEQEYVFLLSFLTQKYLKSSQDIKSGQKKKQ